MIDDNLRHGHSGLAGDAEKIKYVNLEGAPKMYKGTATLVAGTVTITNRYINSQSTVFLTLLTPGGVAGFLREVIASRVNLTSFRVDSTSGADTSTFNYLIVNL